MSAHPPHLVSSPTNVVEMNHRLEDSDNNHVIGEEIELDHPDDPIRILSRKSSDRAASGSGGSSASATATAHQQHEPLLLKRKVSFFSSPINNINDNEKNQQSSSPSCGGSNNMAPMVKIMNTSRADINGKYGYVHAYYRTRERYAVTLLDGDIISPALVYFGVLNDTDIKNVKLMENNAEENEGLLTPQDSQEDGQQHTIIDHHTLFLPPTTVVHLNSLDRLSLFLQYVALQYLTSPTLAKRIEQIMDIIQTRVLPSIRIENFSIFILLILPITLAKLYDNVKFGNRRRSFDGDVSTDADDSLIGSTSYYYFLYPSNIISLFADHKSEVFTLSLLLVGTSTIARFLLSEYRLVKDKAEAMLAYQITDEDKDTNIEKKKKSLFSTMEMFEYRIDYYFSTSKWAKVALLLSFTFILIAVGAGSLVVFMEDRSISNAVWLSWTYVADPGTHADCPEAFLIRLISFTITLGGMLIFALMIGIISDYIAEKVDDLKKGKSRIIDIDHTVMLNWNDKSLAIIQQVALANESEGGGTIVVLAANDKEELETTLASAVASNENPLRLLGTEVIFRSGNPLLESELRRVSAQTARCVISLTLEDLDPDEADATQVRQVMALKAFDEFVNCHVVVEVQDIDNKELFPLVAPDFAEVVVTHDIIGRLMIQCARCPGLASVLEEMMGFEGSEFYFEEWPELTGKSFYDITCRFDDAIPLGVKCAKDGQVYVNPTNEHVINEGDKILVLAEDNDSYEVNDGNFKIKDIGKVPQIKEEAKKVERIMFCGWRRDMSDLIMQLDEYVEEGSELWLFNMVPAKQRATLLQDKGNKEELNLTNLKICNVVGNPVIRRDLTNIKAVDNDGKLTGHTITLDKFDSILILADAVAIDNGANMMSCDSRSLSSLLIIQDIQKKLYDIIKEKNPNAKIPCDPISEILDSRTKSLLSVANCKGYIMSNQIISSVIAQVSEEKDINIVLREILTAEGSETYIRPVSRFIDCEKESEMSFWDIALRARQLREVAVGYKPEGMSFKEASELIINPPDKAEKRKWAAGDTIVTFSMD